MKEPEWTWKVYMRDSDDVMSLKLHVQVNCWCGENHIVGMYVTFCEKCGFGYDDEESPECPRCDPIEADESLESRMRWWLEHRPDTMNATGRTWIKAAADELAALRKYKLWYKTAITQADKYCDLSMDLRDENERLEVHVAELREDRIQDGLKMTALEAVDEQLSKQFVDMDTYAKYLEIEIERLTEERDKWMRKHGKCCDENERLKFENVIDGRTYGDVKMQLRDARTEIERLRSMQKSELWSNLETELDKVVQLLQEKNDQLRAENKRLMRELADAELQIERNE